jgi:proteasome accessory factor C
VSVAQAAKDFAITDEQLVRDLELLFMCGLPGGMPDDLIDAHWEDDQIYLANAGHDRPAAAPRRGRGARADGRAANARPAAGLADRDAINRTIAKLESAAGEAAEAAKNVEVEISSRGRGEVLATCTQALTEGYRLHLRYYVPTRDEITERDVDPMRIVLDGVPYLEGWCHRARMSGCSGDRIQEAIAWTSRRRCPTRYSRAIWTTACSTIGRRHPGHARAGSGRVLGGRVLPVRDDRNCPTAIGCRVGLRTPDTRWVARLVLRLGGAARIVAPVRLSDRVRDQARAALAHYGD